MTSPRGYRLLVGSGSLLEVVEPAGDGAEVHAMAVEKVVAVGFATRLAPAQSALEDGALLRGPELYLAIEVVSPPPPKVPPYL